MDINSPRLTSLLKEALTPQPVPSAKADPATVALVKALVQPPAPSTVPPAQFAAQALNGSLPQPPAQPSQRLSSTEIENAYRAVMEPDAGIGAARPTAPTGRQTADADRGPRGFDPSQPAAVDSTAKVAANPPPSSFSPSIAPATVLVAANSNAHRLRGSAAPRGHAPRSDSRQTPLWMMSIVTALLSAAFTTVLLLLFR